MKRVALTLGAVGVTHLATAYAADTVRLVRGCAVINQARSLYATWQFQDRSLTLEQTPELARLVSRLQELACDPRVPCLAIRAADQLLRLNEISTQYGFATGAPRRPALG